MGLLDAFRDPNDRPKAIALSIAVGAAVLGAAYFFWANREEVKADVASAAHNVKEGIKQAATKVENAAHRIDAKVHSATTRVRERLRPVQERLDTFKDYHLGRFVEFKKHILREKDQEVLSVESVRMINDLALSLSENDFKHIIKHNREERRKLIEHHKKEYEALVIEGINDFEKTFTENLEAILAEFDVSRNRYESSVAEGVLTDPSLALLGGNLVDQMVERLPPVNEAQTPSAQLAVDILNYMADQYKHIMYQPLRKEHWVDTKETMVLDRVHEKYGFEEEDILKLRRDFDSAELRAALDRYNKRVSEDEGVHGNFPESPKHN